MELTTGRRPVMDAPSEEVKDASTSTGEWEVIHNHTLKQSSSCGGNWPFSIGIGRLAHKHPLLKIWSRRLGLSDLCSSVGPQTKLGLLHYHICLF
ncbi:unnamed protein product [Linum trigynum]|uniref:Uncharacterized protein n=1 Tax=Linum trigynum TaxID=586398 RepID=A0AAV2CET8_9ROSI